MSQLIEFPQSPYLGPAFRDGRDPRQRLVEVVLPVYNEGRVLAASLNRLHACLAATLLYAFRITVADNASTDATFELVGVRAVHLDQKGRGRALRNTGLVIIFTSPGVRRWRRGR
jgi:hypothetical protein